MLSVVVDSAGAIWPVVCCTVLPNAEGSNVLRSAATEGNNLQPKEVELEDVLDDGLKGSVCLPATTWTKGA